MLADDPPARTAGEATDRLVALLDEFGFEPERRTAGGAEQIALRHCPFLELAEDARRVVCPVHLGLMQGAMEQLSDVVTVESLEPFAEPDLCLTHLGAR
jgi:predicted ArsR family transcriptional regulator